MSFSVPLLSMPVVTVTDIDIHPLHAPVLGDTVAYSCQHRLARARLVSRKMAHTSHSVSCCVSFSRFVTVVGVRGGCRCLRRHFCNLFGAGEWRWGGVPLIASFATTATHRLSKTAHLNTTRGKNGPYETTSAHPCTDHHRYRWHWLTICNVVCCRFVSSSSSSSSLLLLLLKQQSAPLLTCSPSRPLISHPSGVESVTIPRTHQANERTNERTNERRWRRRCCCRCRRRSTTQFVVACLLVGGLVGFTGWSLRKLRWFGSVACVSRWVVWSGKQQRPADRLFLSVV